METYSIKPSPTISQNIQMKTFIKMVCFLSWCVLPLNYSFAQPYVGINTLSPARHLDVHGTLDQYIRVETLTPGGYESALELLKSGAGDDALDYKLTNDNGVFKIEVSDDDFLSAGNELWRIDAQGQVGIGTTVPSSILNINGGTEASNTEDGYFMIGPKNNANIVMDPNEITARNNNASNSISIQSHGANAYISSNGGDTFFGSGGGDLGIGTSSPTHKLTVNHDGFQLRVQNGSFTGRQWHIGASNPNWLTGDNMLLFSPTTSSTDAHFRLMDVSDNNGTTAPVMIYSDAGQSQTLLLDGNEIDSREGPLYINHNSDQNTYINPSGGRVGMGTSDPLTTLMITDSQDNLDALRLEGSGTHWTLSPFPAFDVLQFKKNGGVLAEIDGASGQWIDVSDGRLKNNILPMERMTEKLNRLHTYTYEFKHDTTASSQIGLIAQEVETEFPGLVSVVRDQYHLAYSKFSVVLLKVLQEQQSEIDALQQELKLLMAEAKK